MTGLRICQMSAASIVSVNLIRNNRIVKLFFVGPWRWQASGKDGAVRCADEV